MRPSRQRPPSENRRGSSYVGIYTLGLPETWILPGTGAAQSPPYHLRVKMTLLIILFGYLGNAKFFVKHSCLTPEIRIIWQLLKIIHVNLCKMFKKYNSATSKVVDYKFKIYVHNLESKQRSTVWVFQYRTNSTKLVHVRSTSNHMVVCLYLWKYTRGCSATWGS